MKKLSILAVMAVLVLGIAAAANAADIKVSGKWQIEAQLRQDWQYSHMPEEQKFFIEQRMRSAFQFIANENLKAVLDTQIGSANWGSGLYTVGAGRSATTALGGAGNGAGNIMLRQGYVEFKLPGTQVNTKAGFQTVGLPAAFGGGSAIFDNQVAALVVSSPIMDGLAVTGGYMRATEGTDFSGSKSSFDAVFAALPITPKGYNITPFAAFGYAGAKSGALATGTNGFAGPNSSAANGLRGYWGGVAFTMDAFEPFKIFSDLNYGKATYNNNSASKAKGGRSGWLFDLAVDYTGLSMMTPEAFFVYTSGEKGNATQKDTSGRMPVIANPQTWTVGSFFFGDKDFITRGNTAADSSHENLGFWALGVSLKDIKLIDKVSHTATVMYAKGTNDPDYVVAQGQGNNGAVYGSMLTTKDSIWEVDFNTKYQMYNELALLLDLGYVNASFDKATWSKVNANYNTSAKDAYKAALSLTYAF